MVDEQRKIATLVFMDLETTGLPSDVGKKNVNITEMSFVAIDRLNFERDQTLRVHNKLSLCLKPRSVISHSAMRITALYNDVLEEQKEFDDSIPKLLEYFFRRLQEPICLLAHNGMKFDFPVLQAELKRLDYSLHPQILCADTIQAFRSILMEPKPPAEKENKAEIEMLLSRDMESFINMQVAPESLFQKCDFLDREQTHKTPPKQRTEPRNELKRKDPTWKRTEGGTSVKRALFPPSMALESLYSHFFGEKPPLSHHAEMDCISLGKVCHQASKDFLKWIDDNNQAFCNIHPLW